MNEVRRCITCNGIECKTFYCPQCGHSETWHNYKHTGLCQCLQHNSNRDPDLPPAEEKDENCKCVREDIAEEMRAISFYNETYNQWCEPWILKCTCENPVWSDIKTHDRSLEFKWK